MRRRKWLILLLGIVGLLVISPMADVFDRRDNIISPIVALVLLAITWGVAERRAITWTLSGLILLWGLISFLEEGSGLFAGVGIVSPSLFLALVISVFLLLWRWMSRVVHIDSEVICAAICGYLLLGVLWTGIYALLLLDNPGALVSASGRHPVLGDLLYFSYTTITTTGFGDIIPADPTLRMFAVLEAIVGVFYNTIVIARLVALYGFRLPGPGVGEFSERE